MSEKTRMTPQLADTIYAHTLVIESTHEYSWVLLIKLKMFDYKQTIYFTRPNQSTCMSIGCVSTLGRQSGFLRHYLLNVQYLLCTCQLRSRLIEGTLSYKTVLSTIFISESRIGDMTRLNTYHLLIPPCSNITCDLHFYNVFFSYRYIKFWF